MLVRLLVIVGVVWYSIQQGHLYAAAFVLVGGFPFRAVAAFAGLPYNPFGWGFLATGCAILFYYGEWIAGSIPLLWAFVWEMWGPRLIGMKSVPEELREMEEQRKVFVDKAEVLCNSIQTELTNYSRSILASRLGNEMSNYVAAAISNYVFHFGYINPQHSVDKDLMRHFDAEMAGVLASLSDIFKTNATGILILVAAARKVDLDRFKKHLEYLASMKFAKVGKQAPDLKKDLPDEDQIYLYEAAMIGRESASVESGHSGTST